MNSGYGILYELARYAGHPGLSSRIIALPAVPKQQDSDSLLTYRQAFQHYQQVHSLSGLFYSDQYIVEAFLDHMHLSYNMLVIVLRQQVCQYPCNDALPSSYCLDRILEHLREEGSRINGFHKRLFLFQ